MISGIHIDDLQVFSHGLFQDILTLMTVLETEELTKNDVERYRDQLLNRAKKGVKKGTSGKGKRKPCKGCKDKKK